MDESARPKDEEKLLEAPPEEPLLNQPAEEKLIPAHASHTKSRLVKIGLGIVGALILFAVLFTIATLFMGSSNSPESAVTPQPTIPVSAIPSNAIPSNWKNYSHPADRYSISMPPDFTADCSSEYECTFYHSSEAAGMSSLVYVSVVPNDKSIRPETVYNYDAAEIAILENMQVGETKVTRPNSQSPELDKYYQFTRLPDIEIAGINTMVFENRQPWEFPSGTIEKKYLFKTSDALMLTGGYTHQNGISEDILTTMMKSITLGSQMVSDPPPVMPGEEPQTACTMDAKLCPDGSSVGRSGPKCEFAACPGE